MIKKVGINKKATLMWLKYDSTWRDCFETFIYGYKYIWIHFQPSDFNNMSESQVKDLCDRKTDEVKRFLHSAYSKANTCYFDKVNISSLERTAALRIRNYCAFLLLTEWQAVWKTNIYAFIGNSVRNFLGYAKCTQKLYICSNTLSKYFWIDSSTRDKFIENLIKSHVA